ncbi:hypothetical protein [Adhaeribacter terreus]|uniref:Lipocalin-like domain-containing protein n=1 Tax=Adhaeribacter terreus TaxID=529703 RepID=A0ABW0E7I6_9BACT
MKNLKLKHSFLALYLFALIFAYGCGNKNKAGATANLYGADSKSWTTDKERDATGDKVKQTAEDEKTVLTFFANGNFSMNSNLQTMNGTYRYDQSGKTLMLTPNGSNTSMSFEVTKLDDDELDLKAPDGSKMELDAE